MEYKEKCTTPRSKLRLRSLAESGNLSFSFILLSVKDEIANFKPDSPDHAKMLTQHLRELEEEGIIVRKRTIRFHPRWSMN